MAHALAVLFAVPATTAAAPVPDPGEGGAAAVRRSPVTGEPVWSVALHVHGSLSEGPGTMASQARAAAGVGVDVLWWTDEDWRVAGHGLVDRFDFEDGIADSEWVEQPWTGPGLTPALLDTSRWYKWQPVRAAWTRLGSGGPNLVPSAAADAAAVVVDERAQGALPSFEGYRYLRLHVLNLGLSPTGADWALVADEGRLARPLAGGVTARLSVRSLDEPRPGREIWIQAFLSETTTGAARRAIRYVIGGFEEEESYVEKEGGEPAVVTRTLPFTRGEWNRYELPLTVDAAPIGGEDNTLLALTVGAIVESDSIDFDVDGVEIVSERAGKPLLAWAAARTRSLGGRPRSYVGLEISYASHLCVYGAGGDLPDFAARPWGLRPAEAVRWAHERGALASLAHPFGATRDLVPGPWTGDAWATARGVAAARAWGADLLEVGYPARAHPLPSFLAVWDSLSAAGVAVTGVGVNDSRSASEGWTTGNRFVTWVYAETPEESALTDALRRGRCSFGDPALFGGVAHLAARPAGRGSATSGVGAAAREGDVVSAPAARTEVTASFRGLPAEKLMLRWVTGRGEPVKTLVEGPDVDAVREVDTRRPTFARAEIWDAELRPIAFTNPVYFGKNARRAGE